jgi:hypothetical protein
MNRDAVTLLHHDRVVLQKESSTEAYGEHIACRILVLLRLGHHDLRLTSSSWRPGTLPDPNIVAFAVALEGCNETAHTSTNDEDVNTRRPITIHVAVSVRRNAIGMGEVQSLLKVSHGRVTFRVIVRGSRREWLRGNGISGHYYHFRILA